MPTLFPVRWQPPTPPASLPRYPASPNTDAVATVRVAHINRGASS